MEVEKWFGAPPVNCEICHTKFKNTFIDGATVMGPWAMMCETCHVRVGMGLGIGRGQKYDVKTETKIAG